MTNSTNEQVKKFVKVVGPFFIIDGESGKYRFELIGHRVEVAVVCEDDELQHIGLIHRDQQDLYHTTDAELYDLAEKLDPAVSSKRIGD